TAAPAWRFIPAAAWRPFARSGAPRLRALLREPAPLGAAVLPELLEEPRASIQLRPRVEVAVEGDPRDPDGAEPGVLQVTTGDGAVDALDEAQLLFHGEVARQGVAPIEDLVGLR